MLIEGLLNPKSLWSSRHIAWIALDACKTTGAMLIMWNDPSTKVLEVRVGTLSLTLLLSLFDGYRFWLPGIYNSSRATDRSALWEELYDLSHLCTDQWIMGGDFKVTRCSIEKSKWQGNYKMYETFQQIQ